MSQPPRLPWKNHGRLKVSDNCRFLVHEDETPFFWLGDTAWEIFHRTTREDVDLYMRTRAEQGFNVVHAVALAEENGLRAPNPYGAVPLLNEDPTTPDVTGGYWDHVDYVVNKAAQLGIYIAFLPSWGDKVVKAWGQGPEVFNESNGFAYGEFLAHRYGKHPNIIWVAGGDRIPELKLNVFSAISQGIRSVDGNQHLMTFHPPGSQTSGTFVHNEPWLDFNMLQTGHSPGLELIVRLLREDYHRTPTKPVLDGEPRYENHPVSFNKNNGYFDESDVRTAMFTSVFNGGCGVSYGCHAVWQFAGDKYAPVNNPISHWRYSLTLPGAQQAHHLKDFMLSLPWLSMKPRLDIVVPTGNTFTLASDADDCIAIYTASGEQIRFLKPQSESSVFSWFDPRSGETQAATHENFAFTPPTSTSRVNDWVLTISPDSTR